MAYIGKSPTGTGVRIRYYFTQTSGGATSISGTDDNNKTLSFSDGEYVDVYLNGVSLVAGTDYNTTTANTIGGLSALANGDVVEVVVYDIFTVADTVSASAGGTFNAAITANQVNVDNIRIDGNTISSTDTNGDITLDPDGTGSVAITGGFTATDGCTITTADNDPQLTLVSTDADASRGPELLLYRNSASPANNDALGFIRWDGENDSGAQHEYIKMEGIIAASSGAATGSEQAKLDIRTMVSGTDRSRIDIDYDGLVINQDGQNLDFRVESSGNANMLFVDAGDNQVRMNTTSAYNSVTANVPVLHIDVNSSDSTPNTGVAVGNLASSEVGLSTMAGSSVDYYGALFHNSGASVVGSIFATTSSTAFNTSSDYRMKENVVDMTGAIARVKQLSPKRFNFIIAPEKTVDGFLAHEAETVVPEAVTGTHNQVQTWTQQEIDNGDAPDGTSAGDNKLDEDGNTIPVYQGIDQAKLVPLLTGALQEAIAKIETLETKVAALEAGE